MVITDSILVCLRQLVLMNGDNSAFDTSLFVSANTAISNLSQLGLDTLFVLENDIQTWADLIGSRPEILGIISNYISIRVRLEFDPPTHSALIESMKSNLDNLEYRIRDILEINEV